ncbi:MAG: hypothetical protein HDT43_04615 [Ruminococcaceae bacterium]|nr:hypothetical protein [Oscillospiraceae bacterium]
MKIRCKHCNRKIGITDYSCPVCGTVNFSTDGEVQAAYKLFPLLHKHTKLKKTIKILSIIAVLAALFCVFVDFLSKHPYLWHYQAGRNRIAILEYAKENYPEAEIVEEYYPSAKFSPTNKPYDAIRFELDGINFYIQARDGIVDSAGDGYGMALLESEVREKYISSFFLQQGLSYDADISFYDYYPYRPQKNASLNTFPGRIKLDFRLYLESNRQTPQNIDWFYDFYCYWEEVCPTKGFILRFHYWGNDQIKYLIYCDSISEFDSKEEFYSASKRLPV